MTRYGGAEAVDLAETVFDADSEAVLALLKAAPMGASADWRWRIAARLVDVYYDALGIGLKRRERLAKDVEQAFRREFMVGDDFEAQLSQRYRQERAVLESLFGDGFAPDLRWAEPIVVAFRHKLGPVAARLMDLAQRNMLTSSLVDIGCSLTHMHLNRMMLSNAREHELIVHAFLHRIYRGRMARGKRDIH